MNKEEANFHQKWYKIFLDIDRNTVGGIGFNPKSVPQYTPENVAEFMKLYKYKRRITFPPVLKDALKTGYTTLIWGAVALCIGGFVTHKYFDLHLDDLHKERATLTKELEEANKTIAAKGERAKKRLKRNAKLSLDLEKQGQELSICEQRTKALEASMAEQINKIKTESDKVCAKAYIHAVDKINDNIVLTTTYSKGIPYQCKVVFNERVPNYVDGTAVSKMKRRSGTNFTLYSCSWCGSKRLTAYKVIGLGK